MNTVNQTFNWKRFVAALRKEVVENKRTILFSTIGIYALLTVIMILGNLITETPGEMDVVMSRRIPHTFVFMVQSFAICIMASMAFKDLSTKSGRTSLLTSPSSTLEKFLVNVLVYIVGTAVVLIVCAQLSDLTRIAALKLFETANFIVPGPINFLNSYALGSSVVNNFSVPGFSDLLSACVLVSMISSASMYLLGSVIWPRLSLLKTYAAAFVIETILVIVVFVVILIVFLSGSIDAFAEWFVEFMKAGHFFRVMIVFSAIQAILFFGLSWYLFKRKDVVSLKWWK